MDTPSRIAGPPGIGGPVRHRLNRRRRDQDALRSSMMNVHGRTLTMGGKRAPQPEHLSSIADLPPNLQDLAGVPVLQP
jgi:hypothetical protein